MLSCAGADRLQQGMRGAFGKPNGTVARVAIGQILLSVRCKDQHGVHASEALRRAKFKFPGRQKVRPPPLFFFCPPPPPPPTALFFQGGTGGPIAPSPDARR